MKEAANSLLKMLEEPPPSVHIFLLSENPGELLPTIRSRCASFRLGALPSEELETLLADRRPELPASQRNLIARLSEGAAGRALSFDLATYTVARADALVLLRNAAADPNHTTLFKMTETYRAGAEGQAKTTALLRALALLLEDLLLLNAGTPELVRNTDLRAELDHFAETLSFGMDRRGQPAASTRSTPACAAISSARFHSTPLPPSSPQPHSDMPDVKLLVQTRTVCVGGSRTLHPARAAFFNLSRNASPMPPADPALDT